MKENTRKISRLLEWLDASPSCFQAVKTICDELDRAGFTRLEEGLAWHLVPGGKYYTVKNSSAVCAFVCGSAPASEAGFRIISSHSDSPCFKIKPNPEIEGDGGVVSLNVEKYGGGILYTWFDRPLSFAGRVMLRTDDPFRPEERLVDVKRAIATIPHLAIHFNRSVNEGNALSVQKDMKPVVGYFTKEQLEEMRSRGGFVKSLLADELNVSPEAVLDYELCLYPCEKSGLVGADEEYFQSGRIDDLSMAFASLEALLATCDSPAEATRVMAVFDNEETGSGTKQGAHSPWLRSVMERVVSGTRSGGASGESLHRAVAASFMISADDAHAWHPNYSDKYDPTNHPVIGGGPVIKINANCKYMTDAQSAAVFRMLCEKAGVKCQTFVNHSDVAGGSTLGNILTGQLPLRGVDMGCAIWAMHSARETAGVSDHLDTVKVFSVFYGA